MNKKIKIYLIIAVLILFVTFSLAYSKPEFIKVEVKKNLKIETIRPASNKATIYSSPKSSFCFYDGSIGKIIFEISYDGNIYINPDIPLKDIVKRVFEMIDEQFYWAKDKCEQENRELKKQLKSLKNE